jgi:hypothetical protein
VYPDRHAAKLASHLSLPALKVVPEGHAGADSHFPVVWLKLVPVGHVSALLVPACMAMEQNTAKNTMRLMPKSFFIDPPFKGFPGHTSRIGDGRSIWEFLHVPKQLI